MDNSGNVLIADSLNGVIRKVDLTGAITTLARNHRDKPLPEGAVDYFLPFGIAVDDGGNVYVTDDSAVWKVNPLDGTATIFAGAWNKRGYSGDGGPATDALMGRPVGLAIDSRGNLFVVDSTNNTVRKVDSDGIITTVAGNQSLGFGYSGDGGPATSAQLRSPAGIAVDGAGNLFIADTYNSVIRKVNAKGIITTVAGLFVPGSAGYEGDGGPATKARLYAPEGVAVDRAGNLYIADTNNDVIRKVNAGGTISTLTGDHASIPPGVVVDSLSIGPDGVAVDKDGNLFVVYTRKNIVERVETNP